MGSISWRSSAGKRKTPHPERKRKELDGIAPALDRDTPGKLRRSQPRWWATRKIGAPPTPGPFAQRATRRQAASGNGPAAIKGLAESFRASHSRRSAPLWAKNRAVAAQPLNEVRASSLNKVGPARIGGRGPGETKLETDIAASARQIKERAYDAAGLYSQARARQGLPVAALVG